MHQLGFDFSSCQSAPSSGPSSRASAKAGGTKESTTGRGLEDIAKDTGEEIGPSEATVAARFDAVRMDGLPPKPSIKGLERVEGVLRKVLGPKVMVRLTTNTSTVLSFSERNDVLYVRAHAIFGSAPTEVLESFAHYVKGGNGGAKKKEAEQRLDAFIEAHRRDVRIQARETPTKIQARGEFHDLEIMLRDLNVRFFESTIRAQITWGRSARNQKRSSIRLGSYSEDEGLIRIHPALDQAFVPSYLVEATVFHEMLHERLGVIELDGRRCIHTPEFLTEERRFPDFERARSWERRFLSRLLKY